MAKKIVLAIAVILLVGKDLFLTSGFANKPFFMAVILTVIGIATIVSGYFRKLTPTIALAGLFIIGILISLTNLPVASSILPSPFTVVGGLVLLFVGLYMVG